MLEISWPWGRNKASSLTVPSFLSRSVPLQHRTGQVRPSALRVPLPFFPAIPFPFEPYVTTSKFPRRCLHCSSTLKTLPSVHMPHSRPLNQSLTLFYTVHFVFYPAQSHLFLLPAHLRGIVEVLSFSSSISFIVRSCRHFCFPSFAESFHLYDKLAEVLTSTHATFT
jgi:hypothetical protein